MLENKDLLDNGAFTNAKIKNRDITYPLKFKFKIGTFANDFEITDANGMIVGYVKQKMFKFIEDIQVYSDSSKKQLLYQIKANKWIDFSASYVFTDENGEKIGRVGRKGWASLWKARYEIFDAHDKNLYTIGERNGWIKVLDGLLCEIPLLGFFSGYLFNPKYDAKDTQGNVVATLSKDPSFLGRTFTLSKTVSLEENVEENLAMGYMMMVLLERRRG
jgi:uncharacterized protein YxjI